MSTPPLDLDRIRDTAQTALRWCRSYPQQQNGWLTVYASDVPALLAELERLRQKVAALECREGPPKILAEEES